MDVPKHVLDTPKNCRIVFVMILCRSFTAVKTTQSAMFFFQVSPFTDMKKRDGFWCVKTFIHLHTAFFLIR